MAKLTYSEIQSLDGYVADEDGGFDWAEPSAPNAVSATAWSTSTTGRGREGGPVGRVRDGLVAGVVGAVIGAVPSSVYGVATGTLLDPTLAAGSILLPDEDRPGRLAAAALPVHAAVSLGWGVVLARVLPRRRPAVAGVLAGLAIAALDLGVGRALRPRLAALPLFPQVADHVAFGLSVAVVLDRRGR